MTNLFNSFHTEAVFFYKFFCKIVVKSFLRWYNVFDYFILKEFSYG